jgi:hypothetical protein
LPLGHSISTFAAVAALPSPKVSARSDWLQ